MLVDNLIKQSKNLRALHEIMADLDRIGEPRNDQYVKVRSYVVGAHHRRRRRRLRLIQGGHRRARV